jgi:hypothetical protein
MAKDSSMVMLEPSHMWVHTHPPNYAQDHFVPLTKKHHPWCWAVIFIMILIIGRVSNHTVLQDTHSKLVAVAAVTDQAVDPAITTKMNAPVPDPPKIKPSKNAAYMARIKGIISKRQPSHPMPSLSGHGWGAEKGDN